MPLILEGMELLARNKPENPIEFLANYILENNPERLETEELKEKLETEELKWLYFFLNENENHNYRK